MILSNSSLRDSYPVSNIHLAWTVQGYAPDWHIDYSLPGNRLHKRIDGTLEVMPKPPGVVLGEWVLRPMIDVTYSLSMQTFQIIKSGLFSIGNILSSPINIFPGAQASSTGEASPTSDNAESVLCPALRVIVNAKKNAGTDSSSSPKLSDGAKNPKKIVDDDLSQDDADFSSPEDAQKYLEARMGKVLSPKSNCLAENEITHIKDIKQPRLEQKEILKKAYALIQLLAREDQLVLCNQRVLELLSTIDADSHSYSIDALHPLPELLSSLLNMKGGAYTSKDLDLLVTKINELSRKMTVQLLMTNDQKAFLGWIDVMLKSAVKKPHFLISTCEVALKVLHSNTAIKWEQKKELRNMARWHQKNSISPQEQAITNKILDATGSQITLINVFFSYLECFPDDMKRFDAFAQDIGSVLFSSSTFKEMTGLIIGLLTFRKIPADYKNTAALMTLCVVLTRMLYLSYQQIHSDNSWNPISIEAGG